MAFLSTDSSRSALTALALGLAASAAFRFIDVWRLEYLSLRRLQEEKKRQPQPAATPLLPCIRDRRSVFPRQYVPGKVSREVMQRLLAMPSIQDMVLEQTKLGTFEDLLEQGTMDEGEIYDEDAPVGEVVEEAA